MHKVRITSSAQTDLLNDFQFDEAQEVGIGGYFLQCLMADIDLLALYGGIHPNSYSEFIEPHPSAFRSQFITSSMVIPSQWLPF
jgi:hypothetical protein